MTLQTPSRPVPQSELPPTTTRLVGDVPRIDERTAGFARIRLGEFGPELAAMEHYMSEKHPAGATFYWAQNKLRVLVDGPVATQRISIRDEVAASQHIKDLARFFRADLVGICRLPPFAVYSRSFPNGDPVELNHTYAIAVGVDQDYRTMNGATGVDWMAGVQAWRGYASAGFIAVQLAHYIRSLGYPARAHITRNYQVVVPPILLYAGFGEISRVGIVLNPQFGLRYKAAVVTTDMPLAVDKPIDFGLQSFCEQCGKCAQYCPSKAITSGGKSVRNGYETWQTDFISCAKFRVGNKAGGTCGRCVKVCPWNRRDTWYHRLGVNMAQHSRLAQKALITIDEKLRSNLHANKADRWWDLSDFADDFSYPWWPGIEQME